MVGSAFVRGVRWLAVLLAIAVALAAAAAVWLSRRPIELGFLTPRLERALSPADGSLALEIEGATLVWDHASHGPEVRVRVARLLSAEGNELARLPEIAVGLSLGALLRGRVAVTNLDFEAPVVRVVRRADGSFDVGLRGDAGGSHSHAIGALVEQIATASDSAEGSPLPDRCRIRNADLTIEDRALGVTWRAPRAEAELQREAGGLGARAELELDLAGVAASLRAKGRSGQDGVRVELDVGLPHLDVSELGRLWPPELASGVRSWVVANIPDGTVENGRLELAARLEPSDPTRAELERLRGSFEVRQLVVRYLDPLPEATDVGASVRFDRDAFDFALRGGRIRDLSVEDGDVTIRGLSGEHQRIRIAARIHGPLETAMAILDLPPLELLSPTGARSEQFRGRAQARVELGFPLERRIEPRAIEIAAEADLRQVEVAEAPWGLRLRSDALQLAVRERQFELSGTALVNSRPADFVLKETFASEETPGRLKLSASLGAADATSPPLQLEVEATRDGPRWGRAGLHAELGDGSVTRAAYAPEGSGRSLEIRSADLGALLLELRWSDRVRGGRLSVNGSGERADAPLAGRFELADFRLTGVPLLARLFEALSLTGMGKALARDGLEFDHFDGDFRFGEGVLEISDANAVGSALAVTLAGRLGVEDRHLDVEGAVVPLRGVNELVQRIPLLGRVVTGKDEALYAAGFRAQGHLTDPKVEVHPWSSLVPEGLRELIRKRPALRSTPDAPAAGRD